MLNSAVFFHTLTKNECGNTLVITGNEPVHTVFFLIADYLPEIPVSSVARIYIPEICAFDTFALFFCSTINCFSFDLCLANVMHHPIDSEALLESEN